jgi:hypothetical protein
MLRYLITTLVFVAFVGLSIWWVLRFHQEKVTARRFLDAVATGRMEEAYRIWKPSQSYSFKDFLEDWGPDGFYGPVHSYHFEHTEALPRGGSGALIVVELSPYSPFPENDSVKQSKNKEARLIVEFSDQSIAFQP